MRLLIQMLQQLPKLRISIWHKLRYFVQNEDDVEKFSTILHKFVRFTGTKLDR